MGNKRGAPRTFDAERLRTMAAGGMPAADIARAMGVSRQRVHQVARREGIRLPRAPTYPRARGRRPPVPRLVTGGVPVEITTNAAGRVCELLVAADLMARGWKVYFPLLPRQDHDLIAHRNGALATFDVRAARKSGRAGNLTFGRLPTDRSDHYALVVTAEPVAYLPELPAG